MKPLFIKILIILSYLMAIMNIFSPNTILRGDKQAMSLPNSNSININTNKNTTKPTESLKISHGKQIQENKVNITGEANLPEKTKEASKQEKEQREKQNNSKEGKKNTKSNKWLFCAMPLALLPATTIGNKKSRVNPQKDNTKLPLVTESEEEEASQDDQSSSESENLNTPGYQYHKSSSIIANDETPYRAPDQNIYSTRKPNDTVSKATKGSTKKSSDLENPSNTSGRTNTTHSIQEFSSSTQNDILNTASTGLENDNLSKERSRDSRVSTGKNRYSNDSLSQDEESKHDDQSHKTLYTMDNANNQQSNIKVKANISIYHEAPQDTAKDNSSIGQKYKTFGGMNDHSNDSKNSGDIHASYMLHTLGNNVILEDTEGEEEANRTHSIHKIQDIHAKHSTKKSDQDSEDQPSRSLHNKTQKFMENQEGAAEEVVNYTELSSDTESTLLDQWPQTKPKPMTQSHQYYPPEDSKIWKKTKELTINTELDTSFLTTNPALDSGFYIDQPEDLAQNDQYSLKKKSEKKKSYTNKDHTNDIQKSRSLKQTIKQVPKPHITNSKPIQEKKATQGNSFSMAADYISPDQSLKAREVVVPINLKPKVFSPQQFNSSNHYSTVIGSVHTEKFKKNGGRFNFTEESQTKAVKNFTPTGKSPITGSVPYTPKNANFWGSLENEFNTLSADEWATPLKTGEKKQGTQQKNSNSLAKAPRKKIPNSTYSNGTSKAQTSKWAEDSNLLNSRKSLVTQDSMMKDSTITSEFFYHNHAVVDVKTNILQNKNSRILTTESQNDSFT